MQIQAGYSQPRVVEFEGGSSPLKLHFKSGAGQIQVVQSHAKGGYSEPEHTSEEAEPQVRIFLFITNKYRA